MALELLVLRVAEEDHEQTVLVNLQDRFLLIFLLFSFLRILALLCHLLLNFVGKLLIGFFSCWFICFFFCFSLSSFFAIFLCRFNCFLFLFGEKRLQLDAEEGKIALTEVTVAGVDFFFDLSKVLVELGDVRTHIKHCWFNCRHYLLDYDFFVIFSHHVFAA